MSQSWTILLEMPPVAKGRPRFGNGRTYTPRATRTFEASAKALMRSQFIMQPLVGPVSVEIEFVFHRPIRPKHKSAHIVKPDVDNLIKAALDAGNGILWDDDAQVCEIKARKLYADAPVSPRVIMVIKPYTSVPSSSRDLK